MAQALVAGGYTLQMLVPQPADKAFRPPDWQEIERHYGLSARFPVRWLPTSRIFRSFDFGVRAVRAARRWEADLIFTRHPQAAAFSAWTGTPTVLEIHDFPQGVFGPLLLRWFMGGRGAVRLVTISHALLKDLNAAFDIPDRISALVAPDGVDLERYAHLPEPAAARAALGLTEGFTAGYTGHLYPGRGVDHILDIANRLPDVHFLIAGGRPEDVEAYREKAGSLLNVRFTGFIPNADLPQVQAACDVLLMPYQHRVAASSGGDISAYLSPMKLFEYLAAGRAVLSSDLPVLREVLDETNAVLLPPEDIEAWVSALKRLRSRPEMRAALAGHARQTAARYSWQARADQILDGLV